MKKIPKPCSQVSSLPGEQATWLEQTMTARTAPSPDRARQGHERTLPEVGAARVLCDAGQDQG